MEYRNALPLLLVGVVVITGCLGGVNADEVRDDSLSAMEEVEAYKYEMDMNMEMGSEEMPGSISMSMNSNGSVNEAERRMSVFSTINSMGFEFGQEAYIINDTMYMRMNLGSQGMGQQQDIPEWFKMEEDPIVSQTWESSNYAEQYKDILEISDVAYDSDASVDGESAYILTLDPDIDEYNQLVQDQMAEMSGMEGSEGMGQFFNEGSIRVEEVSLKYWISKDTNYILRTQSNTTMRMGFGSSNTTGNLPENVSVSMDADMHLSEHGKPVDIQLPEGTEEAEPFDGLFPQEGFRGTGDTTGVDQEA